MRVPRAEPVEASLVPAGFTLVEEDDVAFTLSLCREVHRIYGAYQDGSLSPTDSLKAGLVTTVEMLGVLIHAIEDGMPGMRLAVAAAQTREMLAVMFDEDPAQRQFGAKLCERHRPIGDETSAAGALAIATPAVHMLPVPRPDRRRSAGVWGLLRRGRREG